MTMLMCSLCLILLLFLLDKVICIMQPIEPMHDTNSTQNLEVLQKRGQQFWQAILKRREEEDRARNHSETTTNRTILGGNNVKVEIQPIEPMHNTNATQNLEDLQKPGQQFWQGILKRREEEDRARNHSVETTAHRTILGVSNVKARNHSVETTDNRTILDGSNVRSRNHSVETHRTILGGSNVKVETDDSLKKPQHSIKNISKVIGEKTTTSNHSGITTSQSHKKGETDQKKENESHLTLGPVSRGKLKIPVTQSPNNGNWQETGSEKIEKPLGSPTATKVLMGNVEIVKETNPKHSPSKENPVEEVKFTDPPNRLGEEADEGFQNDQLNVHFSNITPKSEKHVKHETQVNGNDKQSVSLDRNIIDQDANSDCSETKCSIGTSQEHCYGNYCTYVLLFASSLYWHHTLGKF